MRWNRNNRQSHRCLTSPTGWLLVCVLSLAAHAVQAQRLFIYQGDQISPEIENVYVKGLKFLTQTQNADGCWDGQYGRDHGVVGLAVLAMLAHGDDPNYGPYARSIKKGLDYILAGANKENGYIGSSMYNHGFATLALAEAYGHVNNERIGPVLEKAIDCILTAQKHSSQGAWRYSPRSNDADTTVSGAQMVSLFAARNAGIGVPDKAIDVAITFFRSCQSGDGGFGYTGPGGSSGPRTAIGTLIFALARRKDTPDFKAAFRNLIDVGLEEDTYYYYYLYYASQAMFQGDMPTWETWNKKLTRRLADTQEPNGGWSSQYGAAFSTSTALLSLALNYRYLPIYER